MNWKKSSNNNQIGHYTLGKFSNGQKRYFQNMSVLEEPKGKEKITIRFGNYDKNRMLKPKNFIKHFASKLNLDVKSFVSLKKKAKHRFTVISGPHVHKKSRQQYRIDSYVSFFVFELQNEEDFIRFSRLKQEFYRNNMDQGSQVTFKHSRTERMLLI